MTVPSITVLYCLYFPGSVQKWQVSEQMPDGPIVEFVELGNDADCTVGSLRRHTWH